MMPQPWRYEVMARWLHYVVKIKGKLISQLPHGLIIENLAINRPYIGRENAIVASYAKVCDILAIRGTPPFIMVGQTEHGCNFKCRTSSQYGICDVLNGAEFIRFFLRADHA